MKVVTPDGHFNIYFTYDKDQWWTEATIEKLDSDVITRSIGLSSRSKKDTFNRIIGRKVALAKALRVMFPGFENKKQRTAVYKALFDRGMKFC